MFCFGALLRLWLSVGVFSTVLVILLTWENATWHERIVAHAPWLFRKGRCWKPSAGNARGLGRYTTWFTGSLQYWRRGGQRHRPTQFGGGARVAATVCARSCCIRANGWFGFGAICAHVQAASTFSDVNACTGAKRM